MLVGVGGRSFFAKNSQQLQVNVLTGQSEVSEDTLGKVLSALDLEPRPVDEVYEILKEASFPIEM